MLILGSVTRIGVHDELSIWEVLREDESVYRRNNNILVAVHYECWTRNVLQRGITPGCRNRSPFSDRGKLGHRRAPGHREVAILLAGIKPFHVGSPSRLARFGSSEEHKNATGSARSSADSSVKVMPSPPRGPVPNRIKRRMR